MLAWYFRDIDDLKSTVRENKSIWLLRLIRLRGDKDYAEAWYKGLFKG